MWFGCFFKVFRSVSLDLTGYVAIAMVHLKLINMFVEKQVMPATLPDLKVIFLVVSNFFQNNLIAC